MPTGLRFSLSRTCSSSELKPTVIYPFVMICVKDTHFSCCLVCPKDLLACRVTDLNLLGASTLCSCECLSLARIRENRYKIQEYSTLHQLQGILIVLLSHCEICKLSHLNLLNTAFLNHISLGTSILNHMTREPKYNASSIL